MTTVGERRETAGQQALRWVREAVARPGTALGLAIGYCAVRLAFRFLASPNLNSDEAELYLLGQDWHWLYPTRHPPLLVWIARAMLSISDESPGAIFVLKYAVMAPGLAAYVAAARRVLRDGHFVLLALGSLLITPTMIVIIHGELEFSVLLGTATALFAYVLIRALETGRTSDYVALGFAIALGFWSKYVFAIPFAAFFCSVCLLPHLRRRANCRQMFLAWMIACALCSPLIWTLVTSHYSLFHLSQSIVQEAYPDGPRGFSFRNAMWPILAAVEFAAPFATATLVFFPTSLRSLFSEPAPQWGQLIFLASVLGFVAMVIGDLAIGLPGFEREWMYPILLTSPIALLRGVQLSMPSSARLALFRGAVTTVVLASLPLYTLQYALGPRYCIACNSSWPADRFAEQLWQVGFRRGTIYADSEFHGANLRRFFRDAKVLPLSHNPVHSSSTSGQILIVSADGLAPGGSVRAPGEATRIGQLTALYDGSAVHRARLNFVLIGKPAAR